MSLIETLNRIITGWGNYFRHVVSKKVFTKIDHILVGQLKCWAFRRHNRKLKRWIIDKYFKSDNKRKWVFKDFMNEDGKMQVFKLKKLADIPIVRHIKIKSDANPFDPQWDNYFETRKPKVLKALHPEAFINFTGIRLVKSH